MADREKVKIDQLDPYPGKGDAKFKRQVLGSVAIIDKLEGKAKVLDQGGGEFDFDVSDGARGAATGTAVIWGSLDKGMLKIDSEIQIGQGSYGATYIEAKGGGEHYVDEGTRSVPVAHLPKHERKMKGRTVSEVDKLSERSSLLHEKGLAQHLGDRSYQPVPDFVKEKDRPGFSIAQAPRGSKHAAHVEQGRGRYEVKLPKSGAKHTRAGEIINHQAAKRVVRRAEEMRRNIIDDLESIELDK